MDTMTVKTMQPGTHVDITITGPRNAVKRAVARLHGLNNEYSVDIRPSTHNDETHVVVDRMQAESYPAYLAEVVTHTPTSATIAQPEPAPAGATMLVGTGDAKEMPPGLAEELAGMAPEDRAVARRVSDLGEVEPAPGYVERATDQARRDGVL